MTLAVVVVALIVAGRAGLNELLEVDISRARVEKGGAQALLSAGGGLRKLSCPGDLEPETGATIVCTYTDPLEAAGLAAAGLSPEEMPPPKVGRVEIRISGWHTRGTYPLSDSDPEFAARIVERPRRPG